MPRNQSQEAPARERIAYLIRKSVLGPLMMAEGARGVCFAQFGESPEALYDELSREFPDAELHPASAEASSALGGWMTELDAHLALGTPCPVPPLDLRGTAFQLRVWQTLAQTRDGDVLTYSELAERIGAPRAVRAAASACAANRIGVLIPCHRVLRTDGGLGGYRWGLERKRALLDAESRHQSAA
ncbi:MAG: methylated-DNA--[protein]-cysteine S-methyltransferase [Gemmatimonadota bacterium]|jgi:AraC family transcriptional regulator of adaptative response/methylated-DNA-[protein]-cysteine methyltransferase|nr:methylated-DNA--[protein]-cysteine S-methyltransferase [Gemmatimonadota bacterium]